MRKFETKKFIESMKEDHIDDSVTIYDPDRDEFYPLSSVEITGQPGTVKNDGSGILDDGCMFLVIPTE